MPLSAETNYRRWLYDRYVSTHFGSLHPVSPATLEWEQHIWLDYFKPHLPEDKTARIADLGCGYGSFLYFLRAEGYTNAEGVDISPEQVAAARKLGIDNVLAGDCLEFLERRRNELDCLAAIDLLEHFPKEEALTFLAAARGALKPSGMVILKTANADGPFGAKMLYADFTHELAFTPHSIRQVLTATGFEHIDVYPEGPRVHGLISAVRWVAWKFISALLRMYLAVETGQLRGHILTQNLIAVARKPGSAGREDARAPKESSAALAEAPR